MRYRLRTLGGVLLEGPDGPLTGAATQHRRLALLALVAAAGERGVSRDRLIGLLWPDSEPAKARQVLAQWLHLIRRDLREDTLFLGTQELRLNPERITSDVGEYWSALDRGDAERAAALYAGPFLDGFYLSGAPEFERWVDEERTRMAASMRATYQGLARDAAEGKDWAGAVKWGERLAALDPLDADAAIAYMRALDRSGARAKAIQHASVYATIVRVQLGTDPEPAVGELADALRAAPGRPAAPQPPARSDAEPVPPAAPAPLDSTPAPSAAPPTGRPPRTRRALTGPIVRLGYLAGIAAVILFAVFAAPIERPSPASRVMIAAFANETGDTTLDVLGQMSADWITRGVGETGLVDVAAVTTQAVPRGSAPTAAAKVVGAGTLITGRFYPQGDSLAFTASIVDVATERVVRVIEPVIASRARPLAGVEELRRRVMGGIASLVDPDLSAFATMTAQPPSFEAFRALVDGHDAAAQRRHGEAVAHFRRAATLDTGYLYALVRMAHSYRNMMACESVDSLGRVLAGRRERLSPVETHYLDIQLHDCAGNTDAAYRAAKKLRDLTPRSPAAAQFLADRAMALGRPREVLAALDAHLDPPNLSPRVFTFSLSTTALHSLGEHARELETARRGRAHYASHPEPLLFEARALAALGDVAGVRTAVSVLLTMPATASRPDVGATDADALLTIAHELRAHGHPAESRAVATQLIERLQRYPPAAGDSAAEYDHLYVRCVASMVAERWADARAAAETLAAHHGTQLGTLSARGRLAAYAGDAREAQRLADTLAQLRTPHLRGQHTHARAQIAAILGQRERAVQLLRDALAEGVYFGIYRARFLITYNHALPELESLRGYPPFADLLRPRD